MANFNLNDYETVESRIGRFYSLYPDGRIITENVTSPADRERGLWVVKTCIYVSLEEQDKRNPKSTGYAFEVDGGSGASKFAALENSETSSIGRALANMGLHGNKRATREELAKVQRGESWAPPKIDWAAEIDKLTSKDQARGLYALAKSENAPKDVLEAITVTAESFS